MVKMLTYRCVEGEKEIEFFSGLFDIYLLANTSSLYAPGNLIKDTI
jgi:hypothetical protein